MQVALEGQVLAEAGTCVMVFETGLPTRYYVDPTAVNFEHLIATDTITACPYKGVTSGYWSVRTDLGVHPDLAWTYHFPTGAMLRSPALSRSTTRRSTSTWTESGSSDQRPTSSTTRQ